MTIAPLSDETARTIQATLVLNDATSVIKELLDNSLDSRATSITIEISSNTLDVIQVKDNGAGIGIEDRQLLCRRGCTSKIRNLADLETLGGSYLGFRGEALASIAELSETVTITTRVDNETVGTMLTFGQNGKLFSSASASHLVGTTVRVQNFLQSIPVRKQTTLKCVARTLVDIKKLLFHYAFARPLVRFALRVLKAKNDKANWSYVPCSNGDGLGVVAAQIVGKDVTSACSEDTITSVDTYREGFQIRALMIKANDKDLSGTSNVGQYVSVDGRPVTAERGFCRDLTKLYKSHLRHAIVGGSKMPSKPFWALHILCPKGSYDVNVEPAKNEVLFHDRDLIESLMTKMLVRQYGDAETQQQVPVEKGYLSPDVKEPTTFNVLLARKKVEALPEMDATVDTSDPLANFDPVTLSDRSLKSRDALHDPHRLPDIAEPPKCKMFRNMYAIDDGVEDDGDMAVSAISKNASGDDADSEDINDMNSWIRNPFTTAAMHARVTPRRDTSNRSRGVLHQAGVLKTYMQTPVREHPGDISPTRNDSQRADRARLDSIPVLPTPNQSPLRNEPYQKPGPPIPRRRRQNSHENEADSEDVPTDDAATTRQQGFLRAWITPPKFPEARPPSSIAKSEPSLKIDVGDTHIAGATKASTLYSTSTPQEGGPSRPFRSPLRGASQNQQFRGLEPSNLVSAVPTIPKKAPLLNSDSVPRVSSELDDIMDFEHRKKALNRRPKGVPPGMNPVEVAVTQQGSTRQKSERADVSLAVSTQDSLPENEGKVNYATRFESDKNSHILSKPNPYMNRYVAAIRGLENSQVRSPPFPRSLEQEQHHESELTLAGVETVVGKIVSTDPRGYLISHRNERKSSVAAKTTSDLRVKRVKSSRLPLESIPPDAVNHDLVGTPLQENYSSMPDVAVEATKLKEIDKYTITGRNKYTAFSPLPQEVSLWENRIYAMVKRLYTTQRFDSNPRAPRKATDEAEIQHSSVPGSNAAKHLTPTVQLDLATSFEAHLSILKQDFPDYSSNHTSFDILASHNADRLHHGKIMEPKLSDPTGAK